MDGEEISVKKTVFKYSVVVFYFVTLMAMPLNAMAQSMPPDEWEIRLMPYLYFLSIEAESTVSGESIIRPAFSSAALWRQLWQEGCYSVCLFQHPTHGSISLTHFLQEQARCA
jgi:hypothetical protein